MTAVKISRSNGARVDGGAESHVIARLAQMFAANKASAISDLTDSSGGVASTSYAIVAVAADTANVANSGTSLASKATAEAKLNLVLDAIKEIVAKANSVAAVVGLTSVTDSSGGTTADGTIGAIGTTTAATTGVQAVSVNATITRLNNFMFTAAALVNQVAIATGGQEVSVALSGTYSSTVASLTVDGGTAADPGVSKTALDAKLVLYAANIATLAAALNGITGAWTPSLVVVA
jgi:hypothetical protein